MVVLPQTPIGMEQVVVEQDNKVVVRMMDLGQLMDILVVMVFKF
jgi:hypothetical protein